MKKLVLEKIEIGGWGIFLRIIEQTHRESEFGENGRNDFFAPNGFVLESSARPMAVDTSAGRLYVRGSAESYDNDIFIAPSLGWYHKLVEAVRAYNNQFQADPLPSKTVVVAKRIE